jgi:predicted acylesterase/phospholipase RssA
MPDVPADILELRHAKRHALGKRGHDGPGLDTSYPLGLAISGGGHRATLFGLGVLMAMRDAGREPTQISSVSGGSITNAVLARNYFAKVPHDMKGMSEDEFWMSETRKLFDTIVNKGVLTKSWIRALLALMALPPLALILLIMLGATPPWYVTLFVLLLWITLILLRGLLVEWLIARRFFGDVSGKVGIEDLQNEKVEHVICCTDLITGRPLYAYTGLRGDTPKAKDIYRIYEDLPLGVGPRTIMPWSEGRAMSNIGIQCRSERLSVPALVRASAGFPGIPPRRVKLSPLDSDKHPEGQKRVPSVSFLSDGGIWNNLATQPFEDAYLWSRVVGDGTARDYGPWVVIVADASAPLRCVSPLTFHLPGLAEILTLVRQGVILTMNTVAPRRLLYQDQIRRELEEPRSSRFEVERLYPVVSTLETPGDLLERFQKAVNAGVWSDWLDRGLDQSWREERERRRAVTRMRAKCLAKPDEEVVNEEKMPVEKVQEESYVQKALVDSKAEEKYKTLLKLAGRRSPGTEDPVAFYHTTLDKVDREMALALVRRGYANTSLTLYLTDLTDQLVVPSGWVNEY